MYSLDYYKETKNKLKTLSKSSTKETLYCPKKGLHSLKLYFVAAMSSIVVHICKDKHVQFIIIYTFKQISPYFQDNAAKFRTGTKEVRMDLICVHNLGTRLLWALIFPSFPL